MVETSLQNPREARGSGLGLYTSKYLEKSAAQPHLPQESENS